MADGSQLPEPLAQGELARTPFAHVLFYIQRERLGGTLVIWDPTVEGKPTQDRVRFHDGRAVAGRLARRTSRLDRGLLPLFRRREGPYAFYQDVDLVGTSDAVRQGNVDSLPLIAASLRGSSRDDIVDHVVDAFGGATLRLVPGVDLERLQLLDEEEILVELLRAEPATVAKLTQTMPLDRQRVRRLIYLLALTKAVEKWKPARRVEAPMAKDLMGRPSYTSRRSIPVFEPALPKTPVSRRPVEPEPEQEPDPTGPPAHLSDAHRERWHQIDRYFESIQAQNYFEMLGVKKNASPDQVQTAYYAKVKIWHPDRLPGELAVQRPKIDEIFRQLTRAQETLSVPADRKRYIDTVNQGGGTPESERELGAIVQAAMEFRKVEVMMRRRQWEQARALIDRILEASPNESDYHAARGWVFFQSKGGGPDSHGTALDSLERALEISDSNDKAHYYKGMILRRKGSDRAALKHFRRAAELNPHNIDAAREVRIASMRDEGKSTGRKRRRKKSSMPEASIFDKLFGSGKKK